MSKNRLVITILIMAFLASGLIAQQQVFFRDAVIPVPEDQPGGFGNVVAGYDLDNDGMQEIYAVNDNWSDGADEMIPHMYKYEWNGTEWELVWETDLDIPLQNTWPALDVADLDGDGKMELVYGPVNFTNADDNPNPYRIVVYEANGDVLGVPGTNVAYDPNAAYSLTDVDMANIRPIKWAIADGDNDGTDEIAFASRAGDWKFGIVSVDDVPDNGGGTETWTVEFNGVDVADFGSTMWDVVFANGKFYFFGLNPGVYPVYHNGTEWVADVDNVQQIVTDPGFSTFKSAVAADVDNDGDEEIYLGNYSDESGQVVVLTPAAAGDTLDMAVFGGLKALGAQKLTGGDIGDIDADGNADIVFGSRTAVPNNSVYRIEYQDGDVLNSASYTFDVIDSQLFASGSQIDIISLGNLDDEAGDEVVYSGIPRGGAVVPIVVLDMFEVEIKTIAEVRADLNEDGKPDLEGEEVTVIGIISSPNILESAGDFGYFIQDATGGLQLYNNSVSEPAFEVGDRVQVTGEVAFFNGTTEIFVADPSADITIIDQGNSIEAIALTLDEFYTNPEAYEGRFVKFSGLSPVEDANDWPQDGSGNVEMTDGTDNIIVRVDSDTDLDNNPEPGYPAIFFGIATQYTNQAPYNTGYQITPRFYYQDIVAPPSPMFGLISPEDNATITITDPAAEYEIMWESSVDPDGDPITYAFVVLPSTQVAFAQNNDTSLTVTGQKLISLMGGESEVTAEWTVLAKGAENTLTASMDTFTVTLINQVAGPEETMFLTHTPGDLNFSILNEGSIAGAAENTSLGEGVSWKESAGAWTGGPIFGTGTRGTVNGLLRSFTSLGDDYPQLAEDLAKVTSDFESGFMTTDDFDQVTWAKWSDANAVDPYGVEVIQYSYSNTGDDFGFIRYGYVNISDSALIEFHAGIFMDWDIDGNNYGTNLGGYAMDEHLVYAYGGPNNYYFGFAAINGLSGGKVTPQYSEFVDETGVRTAAYDFISTLPDDQGPTEPDDQRSFQGSSLGTIEPGDTAWVTFAIVAGDDLIGIRTNANAAFQKANELEWTEIQVGVEDAEDVIPTEFVVEQNYPNPFNPTTNIRFGLPEQTVVSLRIYDVLGQEVAVLVNNETLNAGTHTVNFNASSLASGTYIYRVQAGDKVFTNKMMLLK